MNTLIDESPYVTSTTYLGVAGVIKLFSARTFCRLYRAEKAQGPYGFRVFVSCTAGKISADDAVSNSHFSGWKAAHRAAPYLDGFLVHGKRGTSFYGLLDACALARLCRASGFKILSAGHVKELAYVVAKRQVKGKMEART